MRELENHKRFLALLGLDASSTDPTVPYDNDFHLLGLDETKSDAEIARDARSAADARAQLVDRIGLANYRRLDVMLRNTINQAGLRFDGVPQAVAKHRDELNRRRTTRLKEIAKALCDTGRWTEADGQAMLEPIAFSLGFTQDRIQAAVAEAVRSAGVWRAAGATSTPRPPRPQPVSTPAFSSTPFLFEKISLFRFGIPVWTVLPVMGLILGLIHGQAGVAYGLLFLVCAAGMVLWDRNRGAPRPLRNVQWGFACAVAASLPLLALTLFPDFRSFSSGGEVVAARVYRTTRVVSENVPLSEAFLMPAAARTPGSAASGEASTMDRSVDGDTSTAFVAGAKGGTGWIEYEFESPVEIDGVAVFSFPKGSEGSPLHQARLSFDSSKSADIELQETDWWQIIPLQTKKTTKVRLTVKNVYGRSGRTGACLNEIWFIGHSSPAPNPRWAGTWDTDWGKMALQPLGNWITVTYEAGRTGVSGRMDLRASGANQLDGFWCRGTACVPPDDSGRIRMVLSGDALTFSGQYKNGFEGELEKDALSANEFNGKRSSNE